MELLSAEEAARYWDTRHRQGSALRSGGDRTFSEPTNQAFYMLRLSLLLDTIGYHNSAVAPLFLLDAGCGKGWFSRELAKFGHKVDGVDGSPSALEECRRLGGGPRYFQSTLAEYRSPWLYDAVASIDVLFHILDEVEWERSVRNLASLVRLGGLLIISDWDRDGDHVYGSYQVVRGRSRYLPLTAECGLRFDGWRPYGFRGSPIGFYVFTRTG
ncbi:MAG TPA: class I SAM-dependent methyltransferase [Micromonosporaceae bacterium]|nr:class I SAM-dependent methyltransferase [Micromonosporaceae bacterium]